MESLRLPRGPPTQKRLGLGYSSGDIRTSKVPSDEETALANSSSQERPGHSETNPASRVRVPPVGTKLPSGYEIRSLPNITSDHVEKVVVDAVREGLLSDEAYLNPVRRAAGVFGGEIIAVKI